MAYHERCQLLNSNPVLAARHFHYRVEVFFKEIIDGPLGKTTYYAVRVEIKVRGSLPVQCFLWMLKTSVLNLDNKEEYVAFLDQVVHTFLPDRHENPKLHELVT